jgi:prohibitin 2
VLLPWDKLFLYDLRLQTHTETYNAISKDGVNLTATINIRFRLKHDSVPQLHQTIGPDYIERMLAPEIGNRAREIFAEYTAEEIYSTKRQEVQKKIRTHTEAMLGQSMIQRTEAESEYGEHYRISLDEMLIIYDTLVLGLELPPAVNAAINRKIEQYYLVQEYAFRVDREKKESERKQIEANGIRDFQQTVSQGISDSYVRWRGIEATLQLAQSPNTKIVIIGSGKDGLPVILGNVDTPMQPNPAPAASPATAPVPDNSEAARQRPASASPPLLEKTPASNLDNPPEQASPAAVPRAPQRSGTPPATAPATPGAATTSGATSGTNSSATPATARSAGANPNTPAQAAPKSSWTWSEVQELISRTVGSGGSGAPAPGPETRPPPPGGGPLPMAAPHIVTGQNPQPSAPRPPVGPPPPPPERSGARSPEAR